MSLETLKGVWWKRVDASEKVWIGIALVWCLILFAMMPLWHLKGGQNPSFETYRTTPQQYLQKVEAFVGSLLIDIAPVRARGSGPLQGRDRETTPTHAPPEPGALAHGPARADHAPGGDRWTAAAREGVFSRRAASRRPDLRL